MSCHGTFREMRVSLVIETTHLPQVKSYMHQSVNLVSSSVPEQSKSFQ